MITRCAETFVSVNIVRKLNLYALLFSLRYYILHNFISRSCARYIFLNLLSHINCNAELNKMKIKEKNINVIHESILMIV